MTEDETLNVSTLVKINSNSYDEKVGNMEIYFNNKIIGNVEIYKKNSIKKEKKNLLKKFISLFSWNSIEVNWWSTE